MVERSRDKGDGKKKQIMKIRSYVYLFAILHFIYHGFSYLWWNSRYISDGGHPSCLEDSLSSSHVMEGSWNGNESMIRVAVFV